MCEFELPDVSLRCFVATQLLLRIYALSSVKFSGLKLWLCKKCDKYEVCIILASRVGLYPCSTKTREVLGNPSPTPERFPETRGRSPREISRVEGNLEGGGDGFPNTSRVLVEHGQSLVINFSTGSGSGNPCLLYTSPSPRDRG